MIPGRKKRVQANKQVLNGGAEKIAFRSEAARDDKGERSAYDELLILQNSKR
jgi:hypothetical protein